jgi:ATP-dependent RNA helicase RhlE
VVEPVETAPIPFDLLGLHDEVRLGVADRGFVETTPIQSATIPLVREGGDLIACAETGTGKTAAFVLPLLDRLVRRARQEPGALPRTRVLVLTPTRELAVQIEDDVQGFSYHASVSSMAVYGGSPMEPQSRALTAGVPFVIATPGRLLDHMRSSTADFGALEVLVLDEADRMLDMGFWPDVRRIVSELPTARQTLLFSATMPDEIVAFARDIMRSPRFIQVGQRNAPARTISHELVHVASGGKIDWLVRFLRRDGEQSLVFVRTKVGAERLAGQLRASGLRVASLHADRSQQDRLRAVEGFKSGAYRVLVATDIAARGLDIDGISHVINYDVPRDRDTYVHRVGRTGRALATGAAITLVSPGDERALAAIADMVGPAAQGARARAVAAESRAAE